MRMAMQAIMGFLTLPWLVIGHIQTQIHAALQALPESTQTPHLKAEEGLDYLIRHSNFLTSYSVSK